MIGKTNSSQGVSSIPSEYVNIRMMTNQASHGDLVGAKFVLSYEKFSQEYVWGGSEMTLQVPAYVVCTIEWGDVEGYKKPEAVTFTTIEDNARTIEVEYECELLTVNVSADQGSVSGFEVTISKKQVLGTNGEYTRLEYIESIGTQYIDTGFKPNQDTEMYLDVSFLSAVGNNIAGVRNTSSDAVNRFGVISFSSASKIGAFFRDSSIQAISYDTYRHYYKLSKSGLIVDGVSYGSSNSGTFECTYPITLGAWNNGAGGLSYNNSRIYSCQIYDNGTLVRDYIPVKDSNGVAGLYDVVNDAFYASSGSEGFIAGAEISEVIGVQTSASGMYKIPFGESYNIEASDIDGFETPKPVSRVANEKEFVATMEYKAVGVKDLSLMDVYGNKIQRSTANCYVVREAGQYKFPLVFGNAIKNGKVNTAAFTNNGGANSHDFVYGTPYTSYESDVITQPYINPYFALSSRDVQIETSDVDGAITDLGLEDGDECKFVTFKVANVPTTGGNVIITLNTAYGDYWSWHIWLWPHDLSPVEITNATGVKYNIMPVNLASKYDSDGIHIKNWFYQWGRPNPLLCPNAWNSKTDHSPGSITKSSKADSLKIGIMNPSKFYYNSASPFNWFGTKSYYNLWDAACTGTGNSDNDTVKTVYDPCPVGWKVPNGNTFTGLSIISKTNGIVKMGRYSGDTIGVGIPLSGYREESDGSLHNISTIGCVWLSSANSQYVAYYLNLASDYVLPQNNHHRANGFSIRPVQDDNIQLDVIMISFMIIDRDYIEWTCEAESGMTWFEWIHSEYNTEGYYIEDNLIYNKDGLQFFEPNDSGDVLPSSNIVGGRIYELHI